ncbi:aminotransferase class I/II-fold pyridoxal phosphate-dependent enzyme [Leuconostocaceae bacterium ESL0723]|nr:aminotransferase class I/II-fold pyridoxal phosphate-dependent enzyme [Leuconostocaceae bacterium ESL0723]
MTKFNPEINPLVENTTPDKLLGFQATVSKIPDILMLTLGEPGFNVSDEVKEAAKKAIDDNRSHYAESQGEVQLRQAAVDYFNKNYNLNFKGPENVIVTLGVTEAINVVFKTLLAPGEGILMPVPAYGPYFSSLTLAEGVRVDVPTRDNQFKLTPAMVEKALADAKVPVKAVLLNYPNNPSGVTYTREELTDLARVFEAHNLWVISDEIYSALTYDGHHVSLAEIIPDRVVLINGLSKSHAMTGYRVGFIMTKPELIKEMQKVHSALTFAIPTFIQDAATVALTGSQEWPAEMLEIYRKRRDRTVTKLQDLGFGVIHPAGAFYIFAKIPADLNQDGEAFALDLAKRGKVAVIPGDGFGEDCADYIRISYAAGDEQLDEGMRRLADYVHQVRQEAK